MNRLFVLFVALLAVLLAWLKVFRVEPPYRKIQIAGVSPLTEESIQEFLRRHPLEELLKMEVKLLARELKDEIPVQEVIVERKPWQRLLRIEIEERQPFLSYVSDSGEVVLLDEEGIPVTLRHDPALILWDRPLLRGCNPRENSPAAGERTPFPTPSGEPVLSRKILARFSFVDLFCVKELVAFSRLLAYEEPHAFESFSEIIADPPAIRVITQEGIGLEFFDPPYLQQLRAMELALREARGRGVQVRSLMMPLPGKVVLKLDRPPESPDSQKPPSPSAKERSLSHEA